MFKFIAAIALTVVAIATSLAARADADVAPPAPVGVAGNWKLAFADEFDGESINTTKWNVGWFGGGITKAVNSREANCYDPENLNVRDGLATFKIERRSLFCGNELQPNATALITSNEKFSQSYGYFESRLRLPAGSGTWPAWWLNGDVWPNDMEIDIVEAENGGDGGAFNVHFACEAGSCNLNHTNREIEVPAATSEFHTYGADVQPNYVRFYYDGKLVGEHNAPIPASLRYLILGAGTNGDTLESTSHLEVDYVRTWVTN